MRRNVRYFARVVFVVLALCVIVLLDYVVVAGTGMCMNYLSKFVSEDTLCSCIGGITLIITLINAEILGDTLRYLIVGDNKESDLENMIIEKEIKGSEINR